MSILNIAAYKFVTLSRLGDRRSELRGLCQELALRGTILLAEEGINLFVAGDRTAVDALVAHLQADAEIGPLSTKESWTDHQPFRRMLVKVKKEIIAFGVDGISPAKYTSKRVSPIELKSWLDTGQQVVLLDTRNDYEVKLGTFKGAERLDIGHFRDFPQAARALPDEVRKQPVVTFCTGGIRCEKAGPMLEKLGFEDVYQLDGGILNYFEKVGKAHYEGDCFVFDQRVAVDTALRETDAAQCYACQAILTLEDQQSDRYVKGESCPFCYRTTDEAIRAIIAGRHEAIRVASRPLPGSEPYDNTRPLHVAGEWHGFEMLDFLTAAVPSVDRAQWEARLIEGRILMDGAPVDARRRVIAGEKYEHLTPRMVEPNVNADIRILHEDGDIVVIDKPAPLPIHPGGRFNKNTLAALLVPAYAPERLRHAHRLDANTTGVALFARRRRSARHLQSQFSAGNVAKQYMARIVGHPLDDEFTCTASIARDASVAGARLLDENGVSARTAFRVVERHADGTTLLLATPITGRTNQIRLHLWSLGHPVLGDPTYQPDRVVRASQSLDVDDPPMCLHSWKISIEHPGTGEQVTYEAPPREWAASGSKETVCPSQ